jgi:hypothetical protein
MALRERCVGKKVLSTDHTQRFPVALVCAGEEETPELPRRPDFPADHRRTSNSSTEDNGTPCRDSAMPVGSFAEVQDANAYV